MTCCKGVFTILQCWFWVDFFSIGMFRHLKSLISLATHKGWKLFQFDVKLTFFKWWIEWKGLYMLNNIIDLWLKDQEYKVYMWNKTLYALKRAPKAWYTNILFHREKLKRKAIRYELYFNCCTVWSDWICTRNHL